MCDNFVADIKNEIEKLDKHVDLSELMVKKCSSQEPDYYDLCAVSSMLHSFYNGVENICRIIAKNLDGVVFSGSRSHSDLLESMFVKTQKRDAVFGEELKPILVDYMGFRHFIRHSYGYSIKWEKAEPLFMNLRKNWDLIIRKGR